MIGLGTRTTKRIPYQMAFDPKQEPCHTCGREPEECICGFAPDLPDDDWESWEGLDTDLLDWDYLDELENQDESAWREDFGPAEDDE